MSAQFVRAGVTSFDALRDKSEREIEMVCRVFVVSTSFLLAAYPFLLKVYRVHKLSNVLYIGKTAYLW